MKALLARKFNIRRKIFNWMFKDSIECFSKLNLLRAELQEKISFKVNLGFN
jgi:hypothetical protein